MADTEETPVETTEETKVETTEVADTTEKVEGETENKETQEAEVDVETLEPETRGKQTDKIDDVEVTDEDEKKISKVVAKQLESQRAELQKMKDEAEVSSYIADNPQLKPYRAAILKYMSHPAYSNIPVKNIAAIVAADKLIKIGAQKEREAQEKVRETQVNKGATVRKQTDQGIDWSKATPEEVQAQLRKIRGIN